MRARASGTARDLLEPVLRSRTMIEGERKEITVLFADIIGSTEMVAGVDPEQAMVRLDGAMRAMTAAVRRHGGFDRPQGDGIMALFGAPLADRDHAARGCLAALAMQGAVDALHEGIRIRVGVHSGPVVVRSIRNGLSTDFDAIGETVHVAARMEQAADPGTIRITGETYRLARDFVQVRSIGMRPVKGLAADIEQYEVVGRSTLRTLWDARASSRLTPFVARRAELAALQRAGAAALGGAGRMILVSGDPGSGKSRLVHEFLRELRTESWIVLRCGAMPFPLNAPYAMLAMLLGAWLGLDEHEAVAAERLGAAVERWQGAGRWVYPALATILDLPVDDPEWRALDPDARRRHTLDAITSWVASLCRERALLLVFEDVHWADSESAAILSLLARAAGPMKLMILATRRLGEEGGFIDESHAATVGLDPLPPEAAREMLVYLLGEDPDLESLRKLLVEKTGGIPFFLEETTRALTETGAVDGTAGGYRRRVRVDDIRVPSTVGLVLSSRIDRLPPSEKELLQIASVIGHEVPVELLQAVADLPRAEVEVRILGLERAGFLRAGPSGLVFEHMLTRDVAYESLLMSRRRTQHQRVVEALEISGAEQLHLLAHHAFQGALWEKALDYLRQASSRALEVSAYTEAISLLEQALETLTHLPGSAEYLTLGVDVRLAMRAALAATGGFGRIRQVIDEAKALATELADSRRLGVIAISEATIHNHLGDCGAAVVAGKLALGMAAELADQSLSISARIFVGQAHLWRGELAELRSVLGELEWTKGPLRFRRFDTTATGSILWVTTFAAAEAFAGRFGEAERLVDDALTIAAETERPYDLLLAGWYRGRVLSYRGDMAKALEVLRETYALSESLDIRFWTPAAAMLIGFVQIEAGRATEGIDILARALSAYRSKSHIQGTVWSLAYLGFARLHEGDCRAAAALGAEALEIAVGRDYRIVEVMTRRLLGTAAGRLGSVAESEEYFAAAMTHAEALGLRPELAHCLFERGQLLRQLAQPAQARAELGRAAALYAEMGMAFWQAKAAAALDEVADQMRQ